MEKIALLTDSACDLTMDEIKKYNINVAPFKVIYSSGEFEDKINISPMDVYTSLSKEVPTTSLPSTKRVEETLNKLEKEGYTHIIIITISSGLSGTNNAIRLILEDHPNIKSFLYDTKTLSMAEGAIVLEAAKMIKEGKSFEYITNEIIKFRKHIHTFFTLDTLEYLIKGGRIGKVTGTIGQILNLKPIITVGDDGIYHNYGKVRGRKQALSKLIDIINEHLKKSKCKIWIMQGNCYDEAISLKNTVQQNDNLLHLEIADVGPALGVHTGPGVIGMIIQEVV